MKQLIGASTLCIRCGEKPARWIDLNTFPLCDDCKKKIEEKK